MAILVLGASVHAAADPVLEGLTLDQADALMRGRNREVQVARFAISAAEAEAQIAAVAPNPTLSMGVARIGPGSGPDPLPLRRRAEGSIGVAQLLERGGKRELRVEAAQHGVSAARSDSIEIERQQRVELARTYFDLLLAQARLHIARENVALFDRTVEAARRRVQAGDLSRSDLARLSVDALRARNEAEQTELERERAQIALAYVIGAESEARRIRAVEPWPPVATVPTGLATEQLIDGRPDVAAVQARVRAADVGRALARALRTRDVTVGVQYDRAPTDATQNSLSVTMSVPLFTRHYYEGEIRRAEVDYQVALAVLERTRAAARAELATAAANVGAAAERVQRFEGGLMAAAEDAANGAEFAYARGAIGVMDLLDARRRLHGTRIEHVAARADYAKALAIWRATVAGSESGR